jgi:hypothetical protein
LKNKFAATWDLLKAYRSGVYKIDGKIIFYHDLELVWMHSKKNRQALIKRIPLEMRPIK